MRLFAAMSMHPKYCWTCDYELSGLDAGVCPECATWFDPGRPETFATMRKGDRLRETASRHASQYWPVLLGVAACAGHFFMTAAWRAPFLFEWLRLVLALIFGAWTYGVALLILIMVIEGLERGNRPRIGWCLIALAAVTMMHFLY